MKIYRIAASAPKDEFFRKRTKGAKKIAKMAKEKGGPSILTYWHFAAKEKPYEMVLEGIEDGEPLSFYQDKFNKTLKKLNVEKMTQQEFQAVMGELEVWGEAICELEKWE